MNQNYEKVIQSCSEILKEIKQECNLEEGFKNALFELTLEWETRKERATRDGREIGGIMVVFMGLLKVLNQTRGLAKRYDKDVCYYLRMSLRNNWLENYCYAMWR